jgi:glycosyltransferase involved in cell wall biosynthesis
MQGNAPGKRTLAMAAPIPGVAGPASFQRGFGESLNARGINVRYGLDPVGGDALLVIGGTRSLWMLPRWKRAGVPIVQRLDGMNWIHRHVPTGPRHYLRAELNNLLLRVVRRMADIVIYQSEFSRRWWERVYGAADATTWVVHNGVPLDRYTPAGPEKPPGDRVRIAVIEGRLGGGYEVGLGWAVALSAGLQRRLGRSVELVVAGEASPAVRAAYPNDVVWKGLLAPDDVPALHRSVHVLFSTDLHPACPNSVIEAMACGNPVVAFDTGAIPELVTESAGAVVGFGADPWRVETPDIDGLIEPTVAVVANQDRYRAGARERAEQAFGVGRMTDGYLSALGW